jgi:hypothetical protein
LDRCALFVDANYALADGALAVHGTRNRDSVSWDYAGFLKLLGGLSRDRTALPLLRCYWYDTASDGARAAEHDALADFPGVKLRLSKARPSRKEGVEAEIRKDLTALARNHAVSDVVIVSAEEDLAPVIAEVQDLGIRTILLHIATDGNWATSRTLRQECDDIIDIGSGHLRPYVDLISGAEPQLAPGSYREIAVGAEQSSGPHPAIEAPAVRLYSSPVPAEYEHAAQLAAASAGQGQDQRRDVGRFDGQAEALTSGPINGGDSQSQPHGEFMPGSGLSHADSSQVQLPQVQLPQVQLPQAQSSQAQPSEAQSSQAQPAMAQPAFTQSSAGQPSARQSSQVQAAQSSVGQSSQAQSSSAQSSVGQSSLTQSSLTQSSQAQSPLAQPPAGQQPVAQQAHGQPPHGQPPQGQAAQGQAAQGQYQYPDAGRGQAPTGAGVGFEQGGGFAGQEQRGQHGQQATGYDQRNGPDDGRGQPGSLAGGMRGIPGGGQPVPQAQNGQAHNGLGHSQLGQNGQSGLRGPMSNGIGGGQQGAGQFGGYGPAGGAGSQGAGSQGGTGQPSGAMPGNGLAPNGMPANGMPPTNGMSANGISAGQGANLAGPQPGGFQSHGPPPAGMESNGTPVSHGGLPSNGAPGGLTSGGQPTGMAESGMPGSGPMGRAMPSAGAPFGGTGYGGGHYIGNGQGASGPCGPPQPAGAPNAGQHQVGGQPPGSGPGMPMQPGLPQPALPQPALSQPALPRPGQGHQQGLPALGQPAHGQPAHGQPPHGQPAHGQPPHGQPALGQPGPGAQQRGGPAMPPSAMPPAAMPPNGMMPLDAQRSSSPQRQLPASNGAPYPQDRSMPYSGPVQPAQFGGPVGSAGYGPRSYGGQQPAMPVSMSVGEAVQSAHAEGFGFGEAVARDAPALWLEAVLARKPRMPSDLEARLLQGSALPIDSLLHDEVRHALRRGFWDALERSRH